MFFGVPSSVTGCKYSVTDWKHSVTELETPKSSLIFALSVMEIQVCKVIAYSRALRAINVLRLAS